MKTPETKTGGIVEFRDESFLTWETWEIKLLKNNSSKTNHIKCTNLMFKIYVL